MKALIVSPNDNAGLSDVGKTYFTTLNSCLVCRLQTPIPPGLGKIAALRNVTLAGNKPSCESLDELAECTLDQMTKLLWRVDKIRRRGEHYLVVPTELYRVRGIACGTHPASTAKPRGAGERNGAYTSGQITRVDRSPRCNCRMNHAHALAVGCVVVVLALLSVTRWPYLFFLRRNVEQYILRI